MRRIVGPLAFSVLATWHVNGAYAQSPATSPQSLPTSTTQSGGSYAFNPADPGDYAAGWYQDAGGYMGAPQNLTLGASNVNLAVDLSYLATFYRLDNWMQALFQFGDTANNHFDAAAINTTISNTTIGLTLNPASANPQYSSFLTHGVYARSVGAPGYNATSSEQAGGAGAAGGPFNFTISNSTVSVNTTAAGNGAVIGLLSQGGAGGVGEEKAPGGAGGQARSITATLTDTTLTGVGQGIAGLTIAQIGGAGGNGLTDEEFSSGGDGGSAAGLYAVFNSASSGNVISTTGDDASGIGILASGGNGGRGSDHNGKLSLGESGSNGGQGGSVQTIADTIGAQNSVSLRSYGNLTITTAGEKAAGIALIATGGDGGVGGAIGALGDTNPGAGGAGGTTGHVSLELGSGAAIATTGAGASAILLQSQGGAGGLSGSDDQDAGHATTAPGGAGGASGLVWMTLEQGVTLNTSGVSADGVTARSVGGYGGAVGLVTAGWGAADGANGGDGGDSAGVNLTSAATITTTGATARGILAQAISGIGGDGSGSGGAFASHAGGPGYGGSVADMIVTNNGSITTSGKYSQGILVQSIAGSGGVGGSATGSIFDDKGGSAAESSNGGGITVTNTGSVNTSGEAAMGIVAQSVGGGGGMGGPAGGVLYAQGGSTIVGGSGGAVGMTLSGSLTTSGIMGHGAVAQSIGGGGGAGGNSYTGSAFVTYAVGGTAASGGDGGQVQIDATGLTLTTTGSGAIGLIAQSVGGGGGSGGSAYGTSAGAFFSDAHVVGGAGGGGGNGGAASVTINGGSISTGGQAASVDSGAMTVDAHGVLVQSIGGGGGKGGGAVANSVAVAMPIPGDESPQSSLTISIAYAMGGSGGNGGSGADATFAASNGATIATVGDGANGAIVQSIGGGGGSGGDSSAMTASFGYGLKQLMPTGVIKSQNIAVTLALGGLCGATTDTCVGGNGGAAAFTLGADGDATQSTITTNGDLAVGGLVQSIGGGGGNAGVGNTSTNALGMSNSYGLTMSIGSTGGMGGDGGTATATVNASGVISTSGESATGLVVQSIGGGGGTGSGGSGSLSGLASWSKSVSGGGVEGSASLSVTPSVSVGAQGGAAGDGGTVTVTHAGAITTSGNDAAGIIAQSIGGGGGIGGSAGVAPAPAASSPAQSAIQSAIQAVPVNAPTVNVNPSLNIGGRGGAAGDGGAVTVTIQGGAVTTAGDYAPGVVAQSVGGGGGRGGVAYANNDSQSFMQGAVNLALNTQLNLGVSGHGGMGGDGAAVTVNLNGGSITTGAQSKNTSGFQSYGVLAQSVGGGGGMGADGSFDPAATLYLGAVFAGGGAQAGNGGNVQIQTTTEIYPTKIQTSGPSAHGIVAQSIGGGGGTAGVGSSAIFGTSANVAPGPLGVGVKTISMGGQGSAGNGGNVSLSPANVSAFQTLTTYGDGAFGILAQSVGGGGGIAETIAGAKIDLQQFGGSAGYGNGGTVTVLNLDYQIQTAGVGGHGIVAQSIGGGGGLVSNYDVGQTPALVATSPVKDMGASGNGAAVSVTTGRGITTSGAGAHGVVAQSIGGGGGLAAVNGSVFAGYTGTDTGSGAGTVDVSVLAPVSVSGANAIGVFAQSSAPGGGSAITVNVGLASAQGSVSGGSGDQGAGIVLVGGNSANQVNVGAGSWVGAASGAAIKQTGVWGADIVTVNNQGTVYGDTWLNGGSYSNGGQTPGSPPAMGGTLTNAGAIVPTPGQRSFIDGHFVQTATGRIAPHLDYSNLRSGRYEVTGNASLDGSIRPTLVTAMPNIFLPVLQVNGSVTGALNAPDSPLFSYTLRETAQKYDVAITGAHFNAARFGLTTHKTGLASSLQTMFFQGKPQLGAFFAGLDGIAGQGATQYQNALGELSPRSAMTLFSRVAADASRIADASMSCPKFGGAGVGVGAQAFLTEGESAYVMTRGQRALLGGDADRGKAHMDSAAWQVGGQTRVAPGLLLGGSLAYQADWFSGRDGVSATGSSVQSAVTLKYQTGPWLLTGALFGSFGEYDTKRRVSVPGVAGLAGADAAFYTAGLRARAAYTLGNETFYLRPYLNLDLVHARNGSFSEGGVGDLGLRIDQGKYSAAILTPAVEFGGRHELSNGMVLRSFVSAGVSLRSNDNWKGYASFNGGLRHQGFAMSAPMDKVAARVGAGLQLFQSEQVDVRIQYDGEFGSEAVKHGATASVAYRF